jgi:hypothetical protein
MQGSTNSNFKQFVIFIYIVSHSHEKFYYERFVESTLFNQNWSAEGQRERETAIDWQEESMFDINYGK